MTRWRHDRMSVRINGQIISYNVPRVAGSTSETIANAKRMADAISPTTGECHGRCKCGPCVANRQHQWTILRAVYRWSLPKIAATMGFDHSTVHHGSAKVSGMLDGRKNLAYVRTVPGKRVRNRIHKQRLATMALRKRWAQETMEMRSMGGGNA